MAGSSVLKPDLCVIGAGSGGLSVAAGAVQMGASVVLIEKGKMGGDCLNYGCVPSKALIAAGKQAHALRSGETLGIAAATPAVDFKAVHDHVHGVIAGIAPHDSQERFEELGVTVIREAGVFTDKNTVTAGEHTIKARRFIIATGSSALIPPIEGLEETGYLTNETLFDLTECPETLLIIGAGPIGLEMAQAFQRLGAKVHVFEAFRALSREDPELAAVTVEKLRSEGVHIHENADITRIQEIEGKPCITFGSETIEGSHLLVAAGRKPNAEKLGLDAAHVAYDTRGVQVDGRLRSTNKNVFAIGDMAGGLQFTHVAGYHAGIVIRNALFRLPAKARTDHIPRVTYTSPEIAAVGLSEAEATEAFGAQGIVVTRWPFADNDRAQAERHTEGFIKVMTRKNGQILGAGIVGLHAGEQIHVWALALASKLKIGAIAGYVAPYPTLAEAGKRAAGQYYTPKIFGKKMRFIVRMLAKLG